MHYKLIIKTIAILQLVIAFFHLVCAGVAMYYGETEALISFAVSISLLVGIGGFFMLFYKNTIPDNISTKDGFLLVALSWLAASIGGSLPFYISGAIPSYTDAFFETISGFSTTGASILTNIEGLPLSILFWRSLTHWLGGMGIVVLAVAILPLLGIGGMQLIKAEAPGPTVDKITPRIAETAKYLWYIYVGFTAAETVLLMLGGMNLFDALTHTFGTVATGGFSTKNISVSHFDSAYIDWVITIFMILAGVNFTLHFRLLTGRFKSVTKDSELKAYLAIIALTTIIITFSLNGTVYTSLADSLRFAAFQVATFITTTGFATANYEQWPYLAQIILFMLMFVGGCSGSTGGGIKVIRLVTLLKQGINEMKYLVHPRGVFLIRLSGQTVKKDIVYAVSGFFFLYIFLLLVVTMIVATSGVDVLTSFTTSLATVGNIGPGFGMVGPADNYAFYPDYVKWTLSAAMIIGRLEIYTILVLFTPTFWRR
ncbi:potassium uptake protein, TrkH family [Denitrovibrio acetiphilus DSM 12809]|uniref:Potassium uptake protein, TrkH family n=1 Tax=Denitrovibrio acetiphilus (strain DSM 12809 / NBRC 114555 / N2460) TaxID=522772 RepID=D4H731_DENA2|nr:TrkH family potassium uptake protein [Denitrovibrio acetiphilus]ADD69735.1 potassium uptake protein, TrkH family [Denitrovibrio acetiphilus DSM 12809]